MKIRHYPNKRGSQWCLDARPAGRRYFATEAKARRSMSAMRELLATGISIQDAFHRHFKVRPAPVLRLAVGAQAAWKEGYRKRMWQAARQRAQKAGLPFRIAVEDIVIPDHCPALGVSLHPADRQRSGRDDAPSLDRVFPELGYVPGNVVVISCRANRLKGDATPEELKRLAEWVDFCAQLGPEPEEEAPDARSE